MTAFTPRRRTSRSAFTLIEMIVVVAIILTLAAIAVPITFSVLNEQKRSIAKSVITGTLVPAVERYRSNQELNPSGNPPENLQDLVTNAGLNPDTLMDPWSQPYQYSPTTSHNTQVGYDIWSTANGGQPIGNWKDGQ